jgi:septum formation protein
MPLNLYLASKSASRQKLLREAQIPYEIIGQDADEAHCDWGLPLEQVVSSIARYKMDHAIVPAASEGDVCFVLTADTLSQDLDGTINGKPVDRADAVAMIKRAREGSRLATAFCLDRKKYCNGTWVIDKRIERCVTAQYIFDIPDMWVERYIDATIALHASNAIVIDDFGGQFLKTVHGSYSTIIGLPMVEVREALELLGFFCA